MEQWVCLGEGRMVKSHGLRGALLIFGLLALLPSVVSIYCDEDDCYDLLGVTQASTASDIKKSYYKLSLKYHPDKNPDPDAKKQFIKIANAYEILSDEVKREQYDYAIAHPEEVFYNTARYYQTYYGPQADLRAVIVGLMIVLSGFQYLNQWTHYNKMLDLVKQTPAYKNRLKALELERNGSSSSKKKGFKIESQVLTWQGRWTWRYRINKLSYSWEDAAYMTRCQLPFPPEAWDSMSDDGKEELIKKRLWVRSNLEEFIAEKKKEARRKRS